MTSDKSPHIVIAGAGLAGIAAANRLRKNVPNATITIIDAKREHHYQPGYTLLATGVWKSAKKVTYQNKNYIPAGVEWVQSAIGAFMPDSNEVQTEQGDVIKYDFLVVATGLRLGYDKIAGLDTDAFGEKGLGSVYHSPESALKTWKALDEYSKKGGRAIMTLAPTFMKCAGAPLKMTFMVQDTLARAGASSDSANIDFYTPTDSIFSVPWVSDDVKRRWAELPIPPQIQNFRRLTAVDMDQRSATFVDQDGNSFNEDYDFLHIVPPMFAPDAVANSSLVVEDGVQKGWLDVNKSTLQHNRYPNIFGLGDINGTPRGKTAATVKKSTPIVVNNLIKVINGESPNLDFDGYTSCPLIIRKGAALLVEFDGDANATPTIPGVDPLKDSYFAWFVEELMLKAAYMAVLKGKLN
ncbi:MAG: NAD(P)/FAD-dependent oxidoreductase [Gammaproteobacteria bacterium]|nr:NAD(P)/FAD-dependent oxidoreductase [Gammaproteobacteria bacterium]